VCEEIRSVTARVQWRVLEKAELKVHAGGVWGGVCVIDINVSAVHAPDADQHLIK